MRVKKNLIEEPTFLHEKEIRAQGYHTITGVDEAGRGPLAGPVVAAAVILPAKVEPHLIAGLRDSKQLTEAQREFHYLRIIKMAEAYSVAQASAREIEQLDIRKASLLAMKRAVEKLPIQPDFVLVDGRDYPNLEIPGQPLVKGDERSVTIGAASIVAKVIRDRIMTAMHSRFPHYGLDHHKGYPTPYHRLAVQLFGASGEHRCTFCGVKEYLEKPTLSPAFGECMRKLAQITSQEMAEILLMHLNALPLSKDERGYMEQSICLMVERLRQRQRRIMPNSVDRGKGWEIFAAQHLEEKGYVLWEKNYKIRGGEIDLIMNRGNEIIFVEVKSRRSEAFGMPYEAVTRKKQQAIMQTAERYLYERSLMDGWDIRYDVVSILAKKKEPIQIEHYEDAFRYEESFSY